MDAVASPMPQSLHTPRLRLSMFTPTDAEALHALFSDAATHTIGNGPVQSLEDTQVWNRRRTQRYAEHGLAWSAVRLHEDERLVGNAGLFFGRTGDEPEIGYEITAGLRGRGYATEAAGAVVRAAGGAGWPRLWATVRPANAASLAVLGRLHFQQESVQQDQKGDLVYLSLQTKHLLTGGSQAH